MRPRSALSLSLVRYCRIHCVGRGCALFSSAHSFVVPSGEGGGDDGVAVLRFAPRPVMRSVFSFRLIPFRASSIRAVANRRRRSHLSRLPARLVPRLVKSSARCPFRLVSRPGLRLAARLVIMPYRLIISFSYRFCLTRCAARLAVAPFCPAHLVVIPMLCRPCRLMPG